MLDLQILQPLMDTLLYDCYVNSSRFSIKNSQFPLHGWLPDAYTYAPPPATAFISGVAQGTCLCMLSCFYLGLLVPQKYTVLGWLQFWYNHGSIMAIAKQI